MMVTIGFLKSQFQWNLQADHPSLVARQQRFLVKFPPIHDFNVSVSFPHNMIDSKTGGSACVKYKNTRNTCMQQPLALIGIQGTTFSEHEVFRDYDFEIVFIFTLSIFFKKCENNESIISFNYKIHNLHKFFS